MTTQLAYLGSLITRRKMFRGALALAAVSVAVVPTVGCDTDWIGTALADLGPAESIITSIAAVITAATGNGALTPVVEAAIVVTITAAQDALTALQQAIAAYESDKTAPVLNRISSAILAAQSSFDALLGQIPGLPADVLKIVTTGVGIVVSVLSTLQLIIPPTSTMLAAKPYLAAALNMLVVKKAAAPSPQQMLYGYNAVVVLAGYAGQQAK